MQIELGVEFKVVIFISSNAFVKKYESFRNEYGLSISSTIKYEAAVIPLPDLVSELDSVRKR